MTILLFHTYVSLKNVGRIKIYTKKSHVALTLPTLDNLYLRFQLVLGNYEKMLQTLICYQLGHKL